MVESAIHLSTLILLVGILLVLTAFMRPLFEKLGVPPLIGYIFTGFLLRILDMPFGLLSKQNLQILEFLTRAGLIILLFRVGLETDISALLRQLPNASLVWIFDFVFNGTLGYLVSHFVAGLRTTTSLFIALALAVTSVGIPANIWRKAKAIKSHVGGLLIDVAELDDISGIVLLTLVLTVISMMKGRTEAPLFSDLATAGAIVVLKLIALGILGIVFSLFIGPRIMNFVRKMESPPGFMLIVAGFGLIIAAIAGLLGFPTVIGAFLAGLIFSRNPESTKNRESFETIYQLLGPFFFIGIGLSVNPDTVLPGIELGGILLITAILGKVAGGGAPTFLLMGFVPSVLIGFSMIPRAEIAMIIMDNGRSLGESVVPSGVFSAMVFVSAGTCIFSPIVVRSLLQHWPQTKG